MYMAAILLLIINKTTINDSLMGLPSLSALPSALPSKSPSKSSSPGLTCMRASPLCMPFYPLQACCPFHSLPLFGLLSYCRLCLVVQQLSLIILRSVHHDRRCRQILMAVAIAIVGCGVFRTHCFPSVLYILLLYGYSCSCVVAWPSLFLHLFLCPTLYRGQI